MLERYRGRKLPVLIFAPSAENLAYGVQSRRIDAEREAFRECDLVLVEIVAGDESRAAGEPISDEEAEAVRRRFGVSAPDFAVVLLDAGLREVRRWHVPVEMDEVFAVLAEL